MGASWIDFSSIFIDFGLDLGILLGGFGVSWGSFWEALGSLGASWGLSWDFLGILGASGGCWGALGEKVEDRWGSGPERFPRVPPRSGPQRFPRVPPRSCPQRASQFSQVFPSFL